MQQVNLYQPMFRRVNKPFSASTLLLIIGVAAGIMMLVSVYGYVQLNELQHKVDVAEQKKNSLQTQLTGVKEKLKPRTANQLLLGQKEKLDGDLRNARRLQRLLEAEIATDNKAYSAYFRGLAEVQVDGLWLKQLQISKGGSHLSLSGQSLKPELLPLLLQALRDKPVFSGQSFGKVRMQRHEGEGMERSLLFQLETQEITGEQPDAG